MHLQGQQLSRFDNEAGQALRVPIGSPDEATMLRGFLQVEYVQFPLICLMNLVFSSQ